MLKHTSERQIGIFGGSLLLLGGFLLLRRLRAQKSEVSEDRRSNQYFPVQSDSERAAGHPIVGVS